MDAMHRRNLRVPGTWPATMNASSTHDTKRSEDVRARIDVLSETASEWSALVGRWSEMNQALKSRVGGRAVPDPNDELLLYQTLVGAWPLEERELPGFGERLEEFLLKAAREEKVHTSWLEPDPQYENAITEFARALIAPLTDERAPGGNAAAPNSFLSEFLALERRIAWFGALNSVSQTLVKAMSPGVPDFYQGTELWDLSLVDPDNRRPVDFERRIELLTLLERDLAQGQSLQGREAGPAGTAARVPLCRQLLDGWRDGHLKMYVILQALRLRAERPALFLEGGYLPLEVRGSFARSLFAFARPLAPDWVVVAAPRLLTQVVPEGSWPLGTTWQNTEILLPPGTPGDWRNLLTGETVRADDLLRAADLFGSFPFALLVAGDLSP
jgi:(1->4)-alpha-D-glucan 1-alpha-D-glucosylmutase